MCTCQHIGVSTLFSAKTIRLDDAIKERLELLAGVTHRSKSFLASEAIREFVELNESQRVEIKAAIQEADREDFASDQDVAIFSQQMEA